MEGIVLGLLVATLIWSRFAQMGVFWFFAGMVPSLAVGVWAVEHANHPVPLIAMVIMMLLLPAKRVMLRTLS